MKKEITLQSVTEDVIFYVSQEKQQPGNVVDLVSLSGEKRGKYNERNGDLHRSYLSASAAAELSVDFAILIAI